MSKPAIHMLGWGYVVAEIGLGWGYVGFWYHTLLLLMKSRKVPLKKICCLNLFQWLWLQFTRNLTGRFTPNKSKYFLHLNFYKHDLGLVHKYGGYRAPHILSYCIVGRGSIGVYIVGRGSHGVHIVGRGPHWVEVQTLKIT